MKTLETESLTQGFTHITKIKSIPIVGKYNLEALDISKSLADTYNKSYIIENISSEYNSYIDYKFNEDTTNLKKEYCKKEDILKVYFDKETYFVMPAMFTSDKAINKYFSQNNNLIENKSLESINITKGKILEVDYVSLDNYSLLKEFSALFEEVNEEENNLNEIFGSTQKKRDKKLKKQQEEREKQEKIENIKSEAAADFRRLTTTLTRHKDDEAKKAKRGKSKEKSDKARDEEKKYTSEDTGFNIDDSALDFSKALENYITTHHLKNKKPESYYEPIKEALLTYYCVPGNQNHNGAINLLDTILSRKNLRSSYSQDIINKMTRFLEIKSSGKGLIFSGTKDFIKTSEFNAELEKVIRGLAEPDGLEDLDIEGIEIAGETYDSPSAAFKGYINSKEVEVKLDQLMSSKQGKGINDKINKYMKKFESGFTKRIAQLFIALGKLSKLALGSKQSSMKTMAVTFLLRKLPIIGDWIGTIIEWTIGFIPKFAAMVCSGIFYLIQGLFKGEVFQTVFDNLLGAKDIPQYFASLFVNVVANPEKLWHDAWLGIQKAIEAVMVYLQTNDIIGYYGDTGFDLTLGMKRFAEKLAAYGNESADIVHNVLLVWAIAILFVYHKEIVAHCLGLFKGIVESIKALFAILIKPLSKYNLFDLDLIDISQLKNKEGSGLDPKVTKQLITVLTTGQRSIDHKIACNMMLNKLHEIATVLNSQGSELNAKPLLDAIEAYAERINKDNKTTEEIKAELKAMIDFQIEQSKLSYNQLGSNA